MIEEPASFQKTTEKKLQILSFSLNNSTNVANVTNPTLKRVLMEISTNNETDNNNKNIEEDKLEVEHVKEHE